MAPGWDVRHIEQEWRKWCAAEEIEPMKPDRHFVKAGLRSAVDRKAWPRLRYPSPGWLSAFVGNLGIVCHIHHKNILRLP